ncbi:MAG TPA: cell division protein FtsH, partial [Actinomycetaceae bacterium]|nr:cell division protein FtsH [Actinomycetaceae bacterium]
EVRALIEAAHDEAWEILNTYRDVLDHLVLELLEHETLGEQELARIFAPVKKRDPRPVWLSSLDRQVSDRPPVLTAAERAKGEHLTPEDQIAAAGESPLDGTGEVPDAGKVGGPAEGLG